jgi:hypothetical protein
MCSGSRADDQQTTEIDAYNQQQTTHSGEESKEAADSVKRAEAVK